MFIRKSAFENLVRRCESQQQQIEKLSEMVSMLAKSLGPQCEVNFEKDWKLTSPGCDLDQEPLLPDWSF